MMEIAESDVAERSGLPVESVLAMRRTRERLRAEAARMDQRGTPLEWSWVNCNGWVLQVRCWRRRDGALESRGVLLTLELIRHASVDAVALALAKLEAPGRPVVACE